MDLLIAIAILGIGFYILYLSVKKIERECPEKEVVYKYIPRTFAEEQRDPVLVTDIFSNLFNGSKIVKN